MYGTEMGKIAYSLLGNPQLARVLAIKDILRWIFRKPWTHGLDGVHEILGRVETASNAIPDNTESCASSGVKQQIDQFRALRLGQVDDVVGSLKRLTEAEATDVLKFLLSVEVQCRGRVCQVSSSCDGGRAQGREAQAQSEEGHHLCLFRRENTRLA